MPMWKPVRNTKTVVENNTLSLINEGIANVLKL